MHRVYWFSARLFSILIISSCLLTAAATPADAAQCDCAQPISNGSAPSATDCLKLLNVAVGIGDCSPCAPCACRPGGGPTTTATDALLCLAFAVGQPLSLMCPCDGVSTTTTTTTLVPKDINGTFDLLVTEVEENCGDGLGGATGVQIVLSQNQSGAVTLVSPSAAALGISDLVMNVVGCDLVISFHEDEPGDGRTCLQGTLPIDTPSDFFAGDLEWRFVGPVGTDCSSPTICSGIDHWRAIRD